MGDESKFGTKISNAIKGVGGKMGYRDDQTKKENKAVTIVPKFDAVEYGIEERTDTGDINNNTINDILTNAFSGNLFDAGISAIATKNIHSSWQLATRPIVDENKYNFLYNLDISNKENETTGNQIIIPPKNAGETGVSTPSDGGNFYKYLDSMEDPTILGYSLMIDKDNSILFNTDTVRFNTIENKPADETQITNEKQNANEISVVASYHGFDPKSVTTPQEFDTGEQKTAPIDDVLKSYLIKYYNNTAVSFLENFRKDIMRVFITPSNVGAGLYKGGLRNHYVKSIDGLHNLDNMFVKYSSDTEPACLTLNLYEDVRLFTTNMKFMYNNFVYNYNQGIRVVPENLLKFNMFVKISEKRTYTLHGATDDMINKHAPTLIYQLHGCEFIFDESIVGSSVTMMGSESNDIYAGLKIKIRYKKVTRIFDKPYGYSNYVDWIIDDTYNDLSIKHPKKDDIIKDLQLNGSRSSLSNQISAPNNSLKSKISKFTNGGVLNTNGKTTLAGKFASSLGNNAIKAGSQFVEEEAKKAKNAIQTNIATSIDRNPVLSGISNNVKNLLKSNITVSTKDLQTRLPLRSILDQNGFASIKNDLKGIGDGNIIQNKSIVENQPIPNDEKYAKDDFDKLNKFVNDSSNRTSIGVLKYDINQDGKIADNEITEVSKDIYDKKIAEFEKDIKDRNTNDMYSEVLTYDKELKEFDADMEKGIKKLKYDINKDGTIADDEITEVSKDIYDKKLDDFGKTIKDRNTNDMYSEVLSYDKELKEFEKDIKDRDPNATYSAVWTYADMVKQYLASKEDIVPDGVSTNVLPDMNLSNGIKNPNILPNEDLSNTTFKPGGYIVEDIVPDSINANVLPNEDLNNGIKNINTLPNEDLSNGNKNKNKFVVEDIVPDGINNNILPNENLNTGVINKNELPDENMNTGKINENKFTINSIIPAIKYNPILPKQDLSK